MMFYESGEVTFPTWHHSKQLAQVQVSDRNPYELNDHLVNELEKYKNKWRGFNEVVYSNKPTGYVDCSGRPILPPPSWHEARNRDVPKGTNHAPEYKYYNEVWGIPIKHWGNEIECSSPPSPQPEERLVERKVRTKK